MVVEATFGPSIGSSQPRPIRLTRPTGDELAAALRVELSHPRSSMSVDGARAHQALVTRTVLEEVVRHERPSSEAWALREDLAYLRRDLTRQGLGDTARMLDTLMDYLEVMPALDKQVGGYEPLDPPR